MLVCVLGIKLGYYLSPFVNKYCLLAKILLFFFPGMYKFTYTNGICVCLRAHACLVRLQLLVHWLCIGSSVAIQLTEVLVGFICIFVCLLMCFICYCLCYFAADFKSIELRLLAHLSGDPTLTAILSQSPGDVFTLLASEW